jgi:hypothetical protein
MFLAEDAGVFGKFLGPMGSAEVYSWPVSIVPEAFLFETFTKPLQIM